MLMLALMAAMFSVFFFIEPPPGQPPPPRAFFAGMIIFFSIFYLLFTLPSVIAAYALLKKKSWARIASIVAAVISAMNVPIGTAACVYALWFFLGDNWKAIYSEDSDQNKNTRLLNREQETRWSGMRTDEKGDVTFHRVEPPNWR